MADFRSIRFQPQRPLLREITADRLNSILTEIRRNRPVGERGITVRQAGDATYIGLLEQRPNATARATPQPWDLVSRGNPQSPGQYLVTVRPGTLNGILPSNWSNQFACASSGLYYAKAVITTDGSNITALSIEIDTTAPTAQAPVKFGVATSVKYLFGLFSQGQVYRVIGDGHIVLQPEQWLIASADPAANPGESPYDIYYRLQ